MSTDSAGSAGAVRIRTILRPGDIGDISAAHGRIYAAEYGWDVTFEAYVAAYLAAFALRGPAEREGIWIAEDATGFAGSIAIVDATSDSTSKAVAQLRWFLVDPRMRGAGLGRRLMDAAIAFCERSGYASVFLDTVSDLHDAARLYARAGFVLERERREEGWGRPVTAQRFVKPVRPEQH